MTFVIAAGAPATAARSLDTGARAGAYVYVYMIVDLKGLKWVFGLLSQMGEYCQFTFIRQIWCFRPLCLLHGCIERVMLLKVHI